MLKGLIILAQIVILLVALNNLSKPNPYETPTVSNYQYPEMVNLFLGIALDEMDEFSDYLILNYSEIKADEIERKFNNEVVKTVSYKSNVIETCNSEVEQRISRFKSRVAWLHKIEVTENICIFKIVHQKHINGTLIEGKVFVNYVPSPLINSKYERNVKLGKFLNQLKIMDPKNLKADK